MKKVSANKYCRGLISVLASVFFLVSCVSCSSDEPNVYIDYYLTIKTQLVIYRRGGLPINGRAAQIGTAVSRMQAAINEVYPDKNMEGDDAAVVSACRKIYYQYGPPDEYSETLGVAILYRAVMSDGIIKHSDMIATFTF